MSETNVELVRDGFDTFNESGVEGVLASGLWSAEIVWDARPTGVPGLDVYRGSDGARAFFEDWFGAFRFAELTIEVDELIAAGDRVVAVARQRGRGSAAGAPVELAFAQVFTLREEKVVAVDVFLERAEAMAAAGLDG